MQFPPQPSPYHKNVLSNNCKNVIRRLLHKDEHRRLGSCGGASDVKSHPFFKTLNFALLRNLQPPIVPRVQEPNGIDAINFRKMPPESMSLDLESDSIIANGNSLFEKFHSSKLIFYHPGDFYISSTDSYSLLIVTLYHEGDSDSEFEV